MSAYHEHILQARDVCANCHRLIKVERVDPVRGGIGQELDSHYSRHQQTTSVEYGPADAASESKGVFCDCGNEDCRVQDRRWSDTSTRCLRLRKVKTLIKHTTETLDEKGVTFDRKRFIQLALQYHRDEHDLDAAMANALETAIQIAVARQSRPTTAVD